MWKVLSFIFFFFLQKTFNPLFTHNQTPTHQLSFLGFFSFSKLPHHIKLSAKSILRINTKCIINPKSQEGSQK